MKKVSKLLSEAESLVKQASWFDNETQKFVLPENLATIFESAKTVKYNPNTIEALKLQEEYKGVTPGKVDYAVKDYVVADGTKMSVAYTVDNEPVVLLINNVFYDEAGNKKDGKPHEVIGDFIADQVGSRFKIEQSGQWIYIGDDLPGEYTQSEYTKKFLLKHRNLLKVKHQATQNFEEIIEIATDRKWSKNTKTKHAIDAKYGFYKYLSKVALPVKNSSGDIIGSKIYDIELLIRNDADGKKYLYDIQNIRENPKSALASTQSFESAIKKQNGVLSKNNIPHPAPIVNAKSAISHKTSVVLKALAKFTGVNIGFANNITDSDGRAVDGIYDSATKQITLSLNAQKPLLFTAIHESMHHIRSYNPKLYALLSANILSVYKNNPDAFNVLFGEKASRYAKDIESLSLDDAVDYLSEELMSDLMAEVMCSPKGLNSLARLDRNTAQRIFDSVIDTFDFMIGRYEKLNVEHDAQMQKAIDLILAEKKSFIDMYTHGVEAYAEFGESGEVRKGVLQSKQSYYDYSKSFSDQIDDFLAGKFPEKDTFIVGPTDDVYIGIGFNPLPMTIAQGHVKVALDKNSDAEHYFGETALKQLPDAIKKPIAVIRSKTHPGRVVALLPILQNGETVITPFEIDGWGKQNNKVIDSNAITSTFGKSNALKQLKNAIQNDSNNNIQLFYWNKKEAISLLQKAGLQLPGILPQDGFIHSIRENGANINVRFENVTETQQFRRFFGKSKVVNGDGTPMVLYHQTDADISVFDTHHSGAGSSDNETPFGIFLKPTDVDIGLRGKKQIALYASIQKPLTVSNRPELVNKLTSISSDFSKLYSYRKSMDKYYEQKLSVIEKEMSDFASEWRRTNPNSNRADIYDDETFKSLSLKEDKLFDEWTEKGKETDLECKKVITNCLEQHGYDGVHILNDEGSYGRKTETWIALHSNQVKSATDNIGTFDKKNPNIRYSKQTLSDSFDLSDMQLDIISDITRRAGERYGIRQLSVEEMKDVSLRQSDIDIRLGRNFRFDDTNNPTNYLDRNRNSLHLSDSVVFSSGKGANANYGTGRILDFGKGDEVIIAVDSGPYSHQITVPSAQVTFIAHNNEQTVSADYVSGNNTYERAKTTFDNFGKSKRTYAKNLRWSDTSILSQLKEGIIG